MRRSRTIAGVRGGSRAGSDSSPAFCGSADCVRDQALQPLHFHFSRRWPLSRRTRSVSGSMNPFAPTETHPLCCALAHLNILEAGKRKTANCTGFGRLSPHKRACDILIGRLIPHQPTRAILLVSCWMAGARQKGRSCSESARPILLKLHRWSCR